MISHRGTVPVSIKIEIAHRGVFTKKNWREAKDWLWKLYGERDWRRSLEQQFHSDGGLIVEGLDSDRLIVITSQYFSGEVTVWSSKKIGHALKYFDSRMREVATASRPPGFGSGGGASSKRVQYH